MVKQRLAKPPLAQFFICPPGRSCVWEYKMAVMTGGSVLFDVGAMIFLFAASLIDLAF
jgi:hypothetical protein